MLEAVPTKPGIASDVTPDWHPDEDRVQTLLTLAGPLDIPNGRCWVDDVLTTDPAAGTAVASGEQGLETSPSLPDGALVHRQSVLAGLRLACGD